jgi:hypothetical protein
VAGSPSDADSDVVRPAPAMDASTPPPDASSAGEAGEDAGPSLPYDGTTGQSCTTDADCQPPGGPGVTQCSTTVFGGFGPYSPTPVCMIATCYPGGGGSAQYCDGPPDDPTSPGICMPITGSLSGAGLDDTEPGICLPKCAFGGGGPASGCRGKDVCNSYDMAVELAPGTSVPVGLGYCFGGCLTKTDCPAGSKCQADEGICVSSTPVQPTKPNGAACTVNDDTTQTCNCTYGPSQAGYCTTFCIAGQAGCPSGWVCETYEPTPAFTTPTAGMGGVCAPACADAGVVCPAGAQCETAYAAGPDCIPQ